MNSCDFGKKLNNTCHKLRYCRKIDLKKFDCYREDAREEVIWRSGITDDKILTICLHHAKIFGTHFEKKHTKCCILLDKHKSKRKAIKGKYC